MSTTETGPPLVHYSVPVSLYCAKTRIMLRHKGLAFRDTVPPGGYGSDAYKEIVPSGNLPAIDDGDILLADSEAIAEYLEERHPEPAMLFGNLQDRARLRERGRFHDTRLEPALRRLFPLVGVPGPDPEQVDLAVVEISARLDQLAVLLGLAPGTGTPGARLSLGDCGYPPTFLWIDRLASHFDFTLPLPDVVADYRARLYRHDAVASEMRAYRNNLDPWIDAKARERRQAR